MMFDEFRKQFYLLLSTPAARGMGENGRDQSPESLANLFIYTDVKRFLNYC